MLRTWASLNAVSRFAEAQGINAIPAQINCNPQVVHKPAFDGPPVKVSTGTASIAINPSLKQR